MTNINILIRNELEKNAEEKYRDFVRKLIPDSKKEILGVRVPYLRKMAKKIVKGDYDFYLKNAENNSYEEIMLQGIVIGYLKTDIDKILEYTKNFVNKIDNWSVCDIFCGNFKIADVEQEKVYNFLEKYKNSKEEYILRMRVVMLLFHFINDSYIERVMRTLKNTYHEGYYLKMAVAWAFSMIYVKYPNKIQEILKERKLDKFIHNKTIQKINESKQVCQDEKDKLKKLKI